MGGVHNPVPFMFHEIDDVMVVKNGNTSAYVDWDLSGSCPPRCLAQFEVTASNPGTDNVGVRATNSAKNRLHGSLAAGPWTFFAVLDSASKVSIYDSQVSSIVYRCMGYWS
jgi:hypothetical protein